MPRVATIYESLNDILDTNIMENRQNLLYKCLIVLFVGAIWLSFPSEKGKVAFTRESAYIRTNNGTIYFFLIFPEVLSYWL